jgi:hypothetical protein
MSEMKLSVTVDIPDDFTKGPINAARLAQMMDTIQEVGATRVHWLYYGEVAPSDPRCGNIWDCYWAHHGKQTIAELGEPLSAAVKEAKARGLEIYGVLKPYNGGLAGSFPAGSPEAGSASQHSRIGGTIVQLIPFLERHPEMRVQRKPFAVNPGPIRKIKLTKSDDSATRLRPEHLRIWVSENNYQYRPLDLVPTGTVSVEPAKQDVRDYHGNLITAQGAPVRVLTLTNLAITEPYVVLTSTFTEGAGDFRNTPQGMVEVIGDNAETLDCVLATHASLWIKPRDFRTYGLEFDQGYGHLSIALDEPWQDPTGDRWTHFKGEDEFADEAIFGHGQAGGFLGIARGKNAYHAATPCEAYAEVRALWLGWVTAMLDAGVDGVDLRISAHGSLSDEPEAYGWNPPVLAEYAKRHGPGPVDPVKLAVIRGDFYTDFVRAASALVRARGKKLQVHLHAEAFRPSLVFGQQHGMPANIEFQWRRWLEEGLADEVHLRTSWFEAAEDPLGAKATSRSKLTHALADPVAGEMLALANRLDLPVTLNRYIGRAAALPEYLDDIRTARQDGRIARFDVYEFFDLAQCSPEQPGLVPKGERVASLQTRWQELAGEADI